MSVYLWLRPALWGRLPLQMQCQRRSVAAYQALEEVGHDNEAVMAEPFAINAVPYSAGATVGSTQHQYTTDAALLEALNNIRFMNSMPVVCCTEICAAVAN